MFLLARPAIIYYYMDNYNPVYVLWNINFYY
jgi:hypothetical protein